MLSAWVALQRLFFFLVMVASMALIVGDAAVTLWDRGSYIASVLSVLLFPATYIIWPWKHDAWGLHLWIAFIAGTVAYSIINAYDRSGSGL